MEDKTKIYHIPGSLTQQKGTINYKGSIRIDGNIKGRIKLKAGGNIMVGDVVEGASLEAEGDIVLQSGISGENTRLESHGSITINGPVEGMDIRCHGDLTLTDRAHRCTIRTQGRLNSVNAILRDCHVSALNGIMLYSVECSSTGATILKVGVNYIVLEELTAMHEALERKRFELQHLLNNLGPMLKRAISDRDYGRRMGQDIDTEMGRARGFKEEAHMLENDINALARKSGQNGVACISVARAIQKGVQLKSERAFLLVTENISGPISFIPDRSGVSFVREKGLLLQMLNN